MPEISRFFGIIIKMYMIGREHNPPHIHALYGEYVGMIEIATGRVLGGDLPPRALKLTYEWIGEHRQELLDIWNTQQFNKLPPLE